MAEMERLVEQDAGIGQLRRGEQSFFRMPGNLASYRMRERAETDYRNAFKYATAKGMAQGRAEGEAKGRAEGEAKGRAEGEAKGRAEGEAKGRAEGEAKGRADTARRMLAHGLSPEQIAKYTDLSLDEIKTLKARMSN